MSRVATGSFCSTTRIGDVLDGGKFRIADRLLVREVEAQALGIDQRALLGHMRSEHLAQRFVQQMGGRMIGPDRGSAAMVDLRLDRHAERHGAFFDQDVVHEDIAELLGRVGHAQRAGPAASIQPVSPT